MSKELEVLNEIEKRLSDVPYQEEIQIIKQALEKLETIESVNVIDENQIIDEIRSLYHKVIHAPLLKRQKDKTIKLFEPVFQEHFELIIKDYVMKFTKLQQQAKELEEKTKVLNEVKEWQNNFNGEYTLDEILDELQNLDDILKQLVGEGDE